MRAKYRYLTDIYGLTVVCFNGEFRKDIKDFYIQEYMSGGYDVILVRELSDKMLQGTRGIGVIKKFSINGDLVTIHFQYSKSARSLDLAKKCARALLPSLLESK